VEEKRRIGGNKAGEGESNEPTSPRRASPKLTLEEKLELFVDFSLHPHHPPWACFVAVSGFCAKPQNPA
jgi:hypothetical protein